MMEKIKELRERTGAGMVDCKKALDEVAGDIEKAIEILRKKGIAKAAKRSEREAGEGIIKVELNFLEFQKSIIDKEYKPTLGKRIKLDLSGKIAKIFQHEIDHLNAKYIYDI